MVAPSFVSFFFYYYTKYIPHRKRRHELALEKSSIFCAKKRGLSTFRDTAIVSLPGDMCLQKPRALDFKVFIQNRILCLYYYGCSFFLFFSSLFCGHPCKIYILYKAFVNNW
ncbi:unnamed protein product, partial [Ixodes pacificus]